MAAAVAATEAVLVHPEAADLHPLHRVELLVTDAANVRGWRPWKLLQRREYRRQVSEGTRATSCIGFPTS